MRLLTSTEIQHFKQRGYVVVQNLVGDSIIPNLGIWIDELVRLPLVQGAQMVYLEEDRPDKDKRISRIEKFAEVHAALNQFMRESNIPQCADRLFGEKSVLFKEKVNFQPPYGGGFAAHQDIQAGWLKYVKDFISIGVTIDESTLENGCTEIDTAWQPSAQLIGNEWEPLTEQQLASATFEPIPTQPGDAVFFDGYIPHRAPPNKTERQRRILFITYSPLSGGDRREQYYADKRASYPPDNERTGDRLYRFRV